MPPVYADGMQVFITGGWGGGLVETGRLYRQVTACCLNNRVMTLVDLHIAEVHMLCPPFGGIP